MTQKPIVHIIGAGLAGLAAAVRLAGGQRDVIVYEAARQAGGRCRSYFDTTLGMVIDNGNHLLLSGNADALDFLRVTGGLGALTEAPEADVAFIDLATRERWRVRPNAGPLPWWIFAPDRRVPGAAVERLSRVAPAACLPARTGASTRSLTARACSTTGSGARFFSPPSIRSRRKAPSQLAGAVIRATFARGGAACRPIVAHGLSAAFIEPAVAGSPSAAPTSGSITGCARSSSPTAARSALDFGDARGRAWPRR